jgi:hypothetical protein
MAFFDMFVDEAISSLNSKEEIASVVIQLPAKNAGSPESLPRNDNWSLKQVDCHYSPSPVSSPRS